MITALGLTTALGRELDRAAVGMVADLDRRGTLTARLQTCGLRGPPTTRPPSWAPGVRNYSRSSTSTGPNPTTATRSGVNELFWTRNPNRAGGRIKARFDDPALFDAIATLLDAKAKPRTGEDTRPAGQRTAEALAEVCGWVLDHADTAMVPETGGRRPHLNVLIRLEDLENRARAAMLDFGGHLSPQTLRMLASKVIGSPLASMRRRAATARRRVFSARRREAHAQPPPAGGPARASRTWHPGWAALLAVNIAGWLHQLTAQAVLTSGYPEVIWSPSACVLDVHDAA